jgi:hypothetical protein
MSQIATVTGTVAAYAGGSIRAFFVPQGGGSPPVLQASGNINASGVFSITAWNNADATLAPSSTHFIIAAPSPNGSTTYAADVLIASTSQDISTPLSGAPAPPGVTQIVAGTNVTLSPTGGTGVVTVNAS